MLKNIIFALLSLAALVATSPLRAAEEPPAEAETVQAAPAEQQAVKQPNTAQPANDNHVDYRYCLDLKTDREIAECRYKK